MSDPKRLLLDPSCDLERTLLGAARARAPLEARRRALLAASAAVAASGLASGTATAAGGLAKIGSAVIAHWITIASIVGVGAATTAVVVSHRPAPAAPTQATQTLAVPSAASVPSAPPKTIVSEPTPKTEVPAELPAIASPSGSPSATWAPSATASSVAAELAFLEQARRALAGGDPARALAMLDQYGARFPRASMGPEATMLRIESLVAAGDRDAAQRSADAFLSTHPASPYAARIRSLLTNP